MCLSVVGWLPVEQCFGSVGSSSCQSVGFWVLLSGQLVSVEQCEGVVSFPFSCYFPVPLLFLVVFLRLLVLCQCNGAFKVLVSLIELWSRSLGPCLLLNEWEILSSYCHQLGPCKRECYMLTAFSLRITGEPIAYSADNNRGG